MEDSQTSEAEYIRRFNDGYILAKTMDKLSAELSKSKSQSPAFLAMQDGRNQYLSEKQREKLPMWLKKDSTQLKTRSFARDKGKSNDPER
ncbi:hypothetical protein LZD49_18340 [Dyadobacter sp. CY261]|uniref:hypothetical protein n=1 Tax=Dyadobacter sp. CY261 TaxID=2907203 RepID=UPI001F367CA5|nr:hypothetical protein [Dyadobacter sp. CY261]MCF0072448.1 hypothetical protein [Dyadobacter sp. CY261]